MRRWRAPRGGEPGQLIGEPGRFVAVALRGHERREDVALAIAKGDHLVAFEVLAPL